MIGGQRSAVRAVVDALGCPFLELPIVSTVHCEIGRVVEAEYRALHDLPTRRRMASRSTAASGRGPTSPIARQRPTPSRRRRPQGSTFPPWSRGLCRGVRVFLEMGPGGSCTRLIDRILGSGRTWRARHACPAGMRWRPCWRCWQASSRTGFRLISIACIPRSSWRATSDAGEATRRTLSGSSSSQARRRFNCGIPQLLLRSFPCRRFLP